MLTGGGAGNKLNWVAETYQNGAFPAACQSSIITE
jgi:hypothetical protein